VSGGPAGPTGPHVVRRTRLEPDEVNAVLGLVDAVTEADAVRPLSEHVMLRLRYGGDVSDSSLLLWVGDELAGYAHLDLTDEVAGGSAELAVHPSRRSRGLGTALVKDLLDLSDGRGLRLWAHGEHPGAAALAAHLGFSRQRVLLQLRRSLYSPLPDPQVADGITVRTFVPGRDEEEWLAVNNRAFADHPEQGRWTLDDVRRREAEPWFDPAGFFLAERDGRIVGFHWTKVHGGDGSGDHGHEPIGEVYVVGVDPSEQGRGLGPALTLLGLHSLADRGLPEVLLYVDEGNTSAIKVYERLGFTRYATDVCFLR